jgi:type III secretory pathway component EscS
MMQLKDKIQNALDESRMLILGAEILVGFEFSATFQEGFKHLSTSSQTLNLTALVLMLLALALLISPAAFHQLTEKGEDSVALHKFTTHVMEMALLPFAVALGANVYLPAVAINGTMTGAIFGVAVTLLAVFFWYGPRVLRSLPKGSRRKAKVMTAEEEKVTGHTPLHDKIRQVLTEARVIIPGNQALLGFQFATVLQTGFKELAPWLKWIHLASLSLIALSTVLLLTPAAYHRIVEGGEETAHFYRVAHIMVLCSLPPLAVGICGDFVLVVYKITDMRNLSLIAAVLMLSVFGVLWGGYPWLRRNRAEHPTRLAA